MIASPPSRLAPFLVPPLLALAAAGASAADTFSGRVVAVPDGDTITVRDASGRPQRVRIVAIDAPERRQRFGEDARRNLAGLVEGRDVVVRWERRDRYGRIVGLVRAAAPDCREDWCEKSLDVGLAQVKRGFAWHYAFDGDQNLFGRTRYALAERQARADKAGLWTDPRPLPPWRWRKQNVR